MSDSPFAREQEIKNGMSVQGKKFGVLLPRVERGMGGETPRGGRRHQARRDCRGRRIRLRLARRPLPVARPGASSRAREPAVIWQNTGWAAAQRLLWSTEETGYQAFW